MVLFCLIDMHTIDCDKLIAMNHPSALVLAVLFDFKGKPEKEVLLRILTGLEALTKDDEYAHGKYTLALETLSLRTVRMEQLPSYEIGFESGRTGGMIEMFLDTLALRFPNFDLQAYKEKVFSAAEEQIKRYNAKLFIAQTPEEVFADDDNQKR